jgi:hypothetical protein
MIPSRIDVIRRAKADVIATGIDPDASECNRFEITKRAAAYLSAEYPEAGLLYKPTGNNCEECAVDIICLKDGTIIDILGSGEEGPNTPIWMINSIRVDPNRWRAPLPYQVPVNPIPPVEPIPVSVDPPKPPIVDVPPPPIIEVPKPEPNITKVHALAMITTVIGALTWLYHIISKSNEK